MRGAVLVTGAARRIGSAIARRFHEGGREVVLHCHTSVDEAAALAAELGGARTVCFDLADRAGSAEAIAALGRDGAGLQTLVLNASRFEPDRPLAHNPALLERLFAVNLVGNLHLVEACFAQGRVAPRTAVFLLDQKLANLNPDFFSYTLSKSALMTAMRMCAMERAGSGDRFYGVAPGLSQPSHDQTDAEFADTARMNLLRRHNRPEEIADAVFFAASGVLESGSVLYADSGQHLVHQPRDVMYQVRQG